MNKLAVLWTFVCVLLNSMALASTLNRVSASPNTVNSNATYTWNITFDSAVNRRDINLTFQGDCVLSSATEAYFGSGTTTRLSAVAIGNVLVITNASSLSGEIILTIRYVKNPYAAISTTAFSVVSSIDSSFSLSSTTNYLYGNLLSCGWAFSLCTEQSGSNLTVTVRINNPIPEGTNNFYIGYGNWVNRYTGNMLTGSSGLTSLVSYDGGVNYAPTTNTASDSTKITVTYVQSVNLTTVNSVIMFIVMGVQSPPTVATPTSNSYWVATANPAGAYIDYGSTITVSATCVLTVSGGSYSPSPILVNSVSSGPTITFNANPKITIQGGDTMQFYFSPLGNFVGCTSLQIWRGDANVRIPVSWNSTYSTYYQYNITSINTPNIDYYSTFSIGFTCTNVLVTSSQTPVEMKFIFKRNSEEYLELYGQMTPTASTISSSNLYSLLSSYEMAKQNVQYTFSMVTAQPLGSTPMLQLTIPVNIIVPSLPTCSVTINAVSALTKTCSYDSNSTILSVVFTQSSGAITNSSNITVVLQGLTNPSAPSTIPIALSTFYSSTVLTSKVESLSAAFSLTFSGITNYPATFTPSNLTVFTSTATAITLTNSIEIPSGSTIYVSYPVEATNLIFDHNAAVFVNGNSSSVSNIVDPGNNSYSFSIGAAIPANSTITLPATIRSPSAMGSYNYVKLRITNGVTLYLQSTSSMQIKVGVVSSMLGSITALNSVTGASSGYSITLSISVPHPALFYIQVDLPTDVSYSNTGSTCSGDCNGTVQSVGFTSFKINVTYGHPNQTGYDITVSLSSTFTNPRSVGWGSPWNITTTTLSSASAITFQQLSPEIKNPNRLTASFLADSYFINNTAPVRISFGFWNSLIAGDYIVMQIPTDIYSELTNVSCSSLFGSCQNNVTASSAGLLAIVIRPNILDIINNVLTLTLSGLISGDKMYGSITVSSKSSGGAYIDQGTLIYQHSCLDGSNQSLINNCKTCYTNGSCIDCYTESGYYMNSSVCVTECGLVTNYLYYANNSTKRCAACINNCYTCDSATVCKSCQSGYYFYTHNSSCLIICETSGFIADSNSTFRLLCIQCYGNGLCLQCNSSAPGACNLCVSGSFKNNGFCQANCTNTSMYPSGGACLPCDSSCITCKAGTNTGCYQCAITYYNYSNTCLSACPNGTAADINRYCTCNSPCLKCQGTVNYCTACTNSSLFVSSGQCLSSCPNQTYISGSTCVQCPTACTSCSSTTCFSCLENYYLYNNLCYSNCNQISQQYDVSSSGTSCSLCPNGCDTCAGTVCSSCLSEYSLSSTSRQCVKTCLLTNSCDYSGQQVLPLPGLIAVVIWTAIVIVIRLILQKSYVPYSLILFNAVVEMILVIAVLHNAGSLQSYSRLLVPSNEERLAVRALLATALATNYITNFIYIVIFVKYIKPLLTNPRQIDVIANIAALVVGTVTNYRFALIAFCKMFPKPHIHIVNGSKLTPIHYLAIISLLLDLFPIAGCCLLLYNQQVRTNLFMLALDLLIIIVLNLIVTIWFVACSKSEEYFEEDVKKYHLEDQHGTNQTMPNQKNVSHANMVANESVHFTDEDATEQKLEGLNMDYKKLSGDNLSKVTIKTVRQERLNQKKLASQGSGSESNVIPVRGSKNSNVYDPYSDPNFEEGLKSKYSGRNASSIPTRDKPERGDAPQLDKELSRGTKSKSGDQGLDLKSKTSPKNYSKQAVGSARYNETSPEHQLEDVEEEDIPDLAQDSNSESKEKVFEKRRQRLARPKRTGTERKSKPQLASSKSTDEPLKIMKKDKKIGYFQSDAFESNSQDIESIIKQKVYQSTIKKQKAKESSQNPASQSNNHSDIAYEEISPSWFNIQNQRIQLSDFEQKESQP